MRRLFLVLALAVTYSGCNCNHTPGDTIFAGSDPNVVEESGGPTSPDADGKNWLLDFGTVRAGATYTKTIKVENRGRADWHVNAAALLAGASDSLTVTGPQMPTEVSTSGLLELTVVWSPAYAEAAQGTVEIDGDSTLRPHITVKITGTALAPQIQICLKDAPAGTPACDDDPALHPGDAPAQNLKVDFGVIGIHDPPAQRTLIVRNTSQVSDLDVALHLSSVAFQVPSPEFSFTLPASLIVAPGEQIEIALAYQPVDGGYDDAVLEFANDDPKKPMVRVDLTGGGRAPRLCYDPSTLDFGQVPQNTWTDREIVISSCGVSPLDLTNVTLASGGPTFLLPVPLQLPVTLAPGANVKLRVRFAPSALGAAGGRITMASSAGDGFVFLKGEGIAAPKCDLQFSQTTLDFGQVPTSGFSDKAVYGTNKGSKPCTITALTGPTGSAAFVLKSAPVLPLVVNYNVTFTLSVRYTPSGTTAETATLQVAYDAAANPVTINLKGQGKTPGPCEIQVSPASLNFGSVPAGVGKAMGLSIYNFGTGQCWLVDGSLDAASVGFSVTRSPMMVPEVLDAGAKEDYEITFAPRNGGAYAGTFKIKAGPNIWSTSTYSVPLSGTAGDASICITPTVLDFGTQAPNTSKEMGFTIQSCGTGMLELRGINLEAGTSTDYTITQKPPVPLTLPPGQTTQVNVKFTASSTGPAFGRVKVLSNDRANPTAPVVLVANSNGCLTSIINCAPTALHFPKTATGLTASLTFTCVSLGTTDVHITSLKLRQTGGPFALSGRPVPSVLSPGQSFRMAVDYSPTTVATDTGFVDITSDDCQRPLQTINLNAMSKVPDFPNCIAPKTFLPVTKWSWTPTTATSYSTVWITPLVVPTRDTNGDGRIDEEDTPSVIFTSTEGIKMGDPTKVDSTPPAVLRALDGHTGTELWTMSDPGLMLNAEAQIAAADIDGDNKVEIIGSLRFESPGTGTGNMQGKYKTGRMVAFENDGTFKWVSDFWNRNDDEIEDGSAISIADLDGDGVPEIIIGASVFDADGRLLWEGKGGMGGEGHGVFSVTADINGDGLQEVIGGNTCYSATGQTLWTYGKTDGLAIIVDVDGDGQPEIVLRTDPVTIEILAANGTKKYPTINLPDPKSMSWVDPSADVSICSAPITAADFDGDGKAELAIPVGTYFAMVKPVTGQVMWTAQIDDYTGQCGAAGAAAFDFEGDGKYEAVYEDTANVWIFRGDGTVIYHTTRSSVTIWDNPVIADVDGDGHADILVIQDSSILSSAPGVKMINNTTNDWVNAPRIWNQHAYHYTNVYQNGTVPRIEKNSWTVFNAYRANLPQCLH